MKNIIEKQIKELREEVSLHDARYEANNPIITDTEYDDLYMKLEKLERENPEFFSETSPTQQIKTTIVPGLKKARHRSPMLSQQKVNTKEEVIGFIADVRGEILVQDKLDGITIVLKYGNGRLVSAVSRGDGETGENLTHNALHFVNIPKVIGFKQELEVRAEAVLPFKAFEELNTDGKYSNPRNLVSGSLRQLDSGRVKGKGFKAIIFDLVYAEGKEFEKDSEMIKFLDGLGFEMVNIRAFSLENDEQIDSLLEFIKDYEENQRKALPFMIDGLVLKINDLSERERLGYTSKHPRWACAYKFESLDATTKLTGITAQVGKTGQITPVAEFETVNIDNVNISRATLHNYRNIRDKDIRINDTILVKRANDVIPQVVKSISDLRDGSEVVIEMPGNCPVCGSQTELEGENLYCIGVDCSPQLEGKLKHFTSRDAMDIKGMGAKTVERFYQEGLIKSITDIYKLKDKKDIIQSMEGYGEISCNRIIEGIEESKSKKLHNLIYGLSIKNIGRSASKDLAKEFGSLNKMIELSANKEAFREKLLKVGTFGEIMADNVIHFFNDDKNIQILKELIGLGLNTTVEEIDIDSKNNSLEGKVFVVTGKVSHYTNRKELQAHIEELGGRVTGGVTKNTDYLINNDKESVSSKNKKAKELNVPIISEEEFAQLI